MNNNGFSIEFPRNGDILTRHDGLETDNGLEITVRGICPAGSSVKVNTIPVKAIGNNFLCTVLIKNEYDEINVECGNKEDKISVRYDKNDSLEDTFCGLIRQNLY